jgi:Spy/CpxP family protein refolding chaperone
LRKGENMRLLVCCGCLVFAAAAYAAEADPSPQVSEEPTLHDHYVAMKQMQERLASRSLDEQAKLQPQIQRAQRQACVRLQKDHQERIPREEYRRQGGDEFLVFSLELEQWCAIAR